MSLHVILVLLAVLSLFSVSAAALDTTFIKQAPCGRPLDTSCQRPHGIVNLMADSEVSGNFF
jgi:hypothetical protein